MLIIITIIAYIVLSIAVNIPLFMHEVFAVMIAIVLIIAMILKYQQKIENPKIVEIATILEILTVICFFITLTYELFWMGGMNHSTVFIILFFIEIFCKWFFEKKED